MDSMTNEPLAPDHRARTGTLIARSGALAARAAGGPEPVARLCDALEVLATRMHEAVAERRSSVPGSEGYRRADELVAYLNELYVRLQRRMEVPTEIWLLHRGRASVGGRRSRGRHPR